MALLCRARIRDYLGLDAPEAAAVIDAIVVVMAFALAAFLLFTAALIWLSARWTRPKKPR